MPYDDLYSDGKPTQLKALATAKAIFGTENFGFNLTSITARDFLVMVLMDRIEGKKSSDMVLVHGFMRCPELGRRTVGGDSYVGLVYSNVGRLFLHGSYGFASEYHGLGLSAGEI